MLACTSAGPAVAGMTQPWPGSLRAPRPAGPVQMTGAGEIESMMRGSGAITPPARPRRRAGGGEPSGRLTSVPAFLGCVRHAAALQHVPVSVILGIIRTESGWHGASIRNANGSHDLGLMQVNGRTWIHVLARDEFGGDSPAAAAVVRHMLRDDDCFNINVGTWIFGMYLDQADGNLIRAVGWYNSHDPVSMHAYQDRFRASFLALFGRQIREYGHGEG